MTDILDCLSHLEIDPDWHLPRPYITGPLPMPLGKKETTAEIEIGEQRLCQVCGEPLDGPAAFIGDWEDAVERMYTEPPMHVPCAEAAMRFCPHLSKRRYKLKYPRDLWVMVITDDEWWYRPWDHPDSSGHSVWLIPCHCRRCPINALGKLTYARMFGYDEQGRVVEVGEDEEWLHPCDDYYDEEWQHEDDRGRY